MSVSATTSSTTSTNTTTADTSKTLSTTLDTFLKLLTTQLKNQDPTSPVDTNQFTQQLATLTSVQAQNNTNVLLQKLVDSSQTNQVSSASSFIGTTIEATGNQGALSSGSANFGYTLSSTAATADVTITDSSGNIVYKGQGPTASGKNVVQWTGLNSFNGGTEPDGTYTISVTAKDSAGNTITATPYITGVVDSATINKGTIQLDIKGLQFPQSSVTSISNISNTKTATTTG